MSNSPATKRQLDLEMRRLRLARLKSEIKSKELSLQARLLAMKQKGC